MALLKITIGLWCSSMACYVTRSSSNRENLGHVEKRIFTISECYQTCWSVAILKTESTTKRHRSHNRAPPPSNIGFYSWQMSLYNLVKLTLFLLLDNKVFCSHFTIISSFNQTIFTYCKFHGRDSNFSGCIYFFFAREFVWKDIKIKPF